VIFGVTLGLVVLGIWAAVSILGRMTASNPPNPKLGEPSVGGTIVNEPLNALPRARTVDVDGFNLSISRANFFNSKEFDVANLDVGKDFLVDFDIKSTRIGGSTRYGIAWNYQSDDFLLFTLHSVDFGYYSIGPGRSRTYTPFARFSEGRVNINAERGFDSLGLAKKGDDLAFLVNGQEVWKTNLYKLVSNRFAFWVADYSDEVMRSYTVRQ
jgi:hypothetical protein